MAMCPWKIIAVGLALFCASGCAVFRSGSAPPPAPTEVRYVGKAVGALPGEEVDPYMGALYADLRQKLADEVGNGVREVERFSGTMVKVTIAADASFEFDSAQLKPETLILYSKLAEALKSYDKTVAHVVAHTDSQGDTNYSEGLSERRAESVASFLAGQGLPQTRIRAEGRGGLEPVAGNKSADGRKRNRRVDIVIKPVVQGREKNAWMPPPRLDQAS